MASELGFGDAPPSCPKMMAASNCGAGRGTGRVGGTARIGLAVIDGIAGLAEAMLAKARFT